MFRFGLPKITGEYGGSGIGVEKGRVPQGKRGHTK